jgi:3-hydroxyacyl-CoA dehydrogenase, C-terminal domain
MKLGAGYPMGPFELLDYTGLDLHKVPLGPHRRTPKLRVSLGSRGLAPPHLLYKLGGGGGGFLPGFRVQVGV